MAIDPHPYGADGDAPVAQRALRRRGLKLAAAVVVVAGLTGLGWYVYDQATRPRGGEVPLIKADDRPTKKRPDEPGGMAIPNQDKLVYETLSEEEGEGIVERLLPPPEEPLLPPAPPRPEAAPTERAAAPAPAPEPEPAPVVATAAPAPAAKAIMVQLAAFRSAPAADAAWRRMLKDNSDLLGDLKPKVERADLGADKGVFYRLRAGPLGDEAAANKLCARLKARKLDCLIVRP